MIHRTLALVCSLWFSGAAFAQSPPGAGGPMSPMNSPGFISDGTTQISCQGGVADDTAAVIAGFASAAAGKKRVLLPAGQCNVCPSGGSVVTITGSNWDISGYGDATTIKLTCDGEFIRDDISTITSNLNRFHDWRTISTLGTGNQTSSNAIRLFCATPGAAPCQLATFIDFINLTFSGVYRGVKIDETSYLTYQSQAQIQNYGHLHFYNLNSDLSSGTSLYEVVHFDTGPGAHNIFWGGTWTAINAGLAMGNGISGLGDQLIETVHFINSAYGIYINGPVDLTRYRHNFTITGNQYDGITTNTVFATNLTSCQIGLSNSTSAVGYSLAGTSCEFMEDRNAANAYHGVPSKAFASGTISQGLFDIVRVPIGASGNLYDSVLVDIFATGLIGTIGDCILTGQYLVQFSGTTGTTISPPIQLSINGPGASYLTLSIAQQGLDRARATFTMTGTPSTNTLVVYVRITGAAGRFQLVTGS